MCVGKEVIDYLHFVSWQASLLGLQALLSAILRLLQQLMPRIEQELVSSFGSLSYCLMFFKCSVLRLRVVAVRRGRDEAMDHLWGTRVGFMLLREESSPLFFHFVQNEGDASFGSSFSCATIEIALRLISIGIALTTLSLVTIEIALRWISMGIALTTLSFVVVSYHRGSTAMDQYGNSIDHPFFRCR